MCKIANTLDDAVNQTRLLTGAVRRLSDEPFVKKSMMFMAPGTWAVQRLLHCDPASSKGLDRVIFDGFGMSAHGPLMP